MKVLISAYACEPQAGSEPGVGWNWVYQIAKNGNQVWVVTRPMHKKIIENYLNSIDLEIRKNMNFLYYDLPIWERKRGGKGVHAHYQLWQLGIYKLCKGLIRDYDIDLIHHITFVSTRFPSFLGLLGKPFVFGPVAGGEKPPRNLTKGYSLKGKLKDIIRNLTMSSVKVNPLMHMTFKTADKLIVTSKQTKNVIPKRYHSKTEVGFAIGIDKVCTDLNRKRSDQFKVLYVGNLLYWKGVHLALKSFDSFNVKTQNKDSVFTLIGDGPDKNWLRNQWKGLESKNQIEWLGKMDRLELMEIYKNYDVLLFPSLHDSGGMVVLEALANGLPVICLDIGGPGTIITDNCGISVDVKGKSEDEVIFELSEGLSKYYKDKDKLETDSKQAIKRAEDFVWESLVEDVYRSLSYKRG
ncbi:glycosyltransferase family 4 protein [Bacillus paramobilis]|uniref:glycosyltransferase family 4 protein n=1 Tax=Bacillus paramobilis TaxID=2817477 RepID=UPI003D25E60E